MKRTAFLVLLLFALAPALGAQGPTPPGLPDASWAKMTGRVLDEVTGQPAPGVLMLLQCNWADGQWGRATGTTDASGQFTIGTPPGQCTLVVNARPNGKYEQNGLPLFEFAPGETVEVVRRLPHYPAIPPFEGRVVDDRGEPVRDAAIILRSSSIRAGTRQWVAQRAPLRTDATGAFKSTIYSDGPWEVIVPALGLSRLVEVTRGAPLPAIELRGARLPAFRVSGRVETPPGRQPNGIVFLDRADASSSNPLTVAYVTSDSGGSFSFPDVPAGSYRLRIDTSPPTPTGPGNGPAEILWAIMPVVVTRDVSGVVLTARPGPELRAEVRLDDQPGGPAVRQRVLLSFDAASGRFTPTFLADAGRVITSGLFPDRYRVRATGIPSGYRVKSVTLAGRDVTLEGFDLSTGPIEDLTITLTKRLTEVKGVVRDAQERPAGEAAVLAFPTDRRLWTETGQTPVFIDRVPVSQKGNYSLKGLPAGEYFVVAAASNAIPFGTTDAETLARLAPVAQRIQLGEAQTLTVDLRTRN